MPIYQYFIKGFRKIAKLLTFILQTTLTKYTWYLLPSLNIVKEDEFGSDKYKSIRKSRNEIVKMLAKLKSWNLAKSRSKNLLRFKKV